jgi:galactokinase
VALPQEGVRTYHAPGRVNLIGEHTDYNGGFVLPAAIGLSCTIRVSPLAGGKLVIRSKQMPDTAEVEVDSLARAEPRGHWSDYAIGVAKEIVALGMAVDAAELAIDATVPTGSGLSSSAALEVATAYALLAGRPLEKLLIARLCQRAERNFVGMPCGIMDQYAAVFGVAHHAILLDCRALTHQLVPIPDGVEIVAVNSMVKHELGSSAYRQRVAECAMALSHFPGKQTLRDVSLAELERTASQIPEIPLSRARHVILECWRVQQFHAAAQAGDLERLGQLFVESHRSLQHDYQVSCEELDYLVDTALTIPGVYGARMTGGGFGGCTVNLVQPAALERFENEIAARYHERFRLHPTVIRCVPSAGGGLVAE